MVAIKKISDEFEFKPNQINRLHVNDVLNYHLNYLKSTIMS